MWQVSMHGNTDHLDPDVADEAEVTLRDKLAALFGELVAEGHQGIAGVFHHSKGGPVDLAGPAPAPAAVAAVEAPAEPEAAPEPVNPSPAAEAAPVVTTEAAPEPAPAETGATEAAS